MLVKVALELVLVNAASNPMPKSRNLRLRGKISEVEVQEIVDEIQQGINSTTSETDEQPGGMPFVLSYQTYFYQLSGVSDAFAVTLGAFALMLAGNFGAMILPDFAGQRKIMVYGAATLILWDVIIGGCGFAGTGNKPAVTASVAFVASWAFFYQLTIGTVGFVVAPELPAQRLRAKTQAFATAFANLIGWGVSFALPYLFNPDEANLGARLLLIFVGLVTPLTFYLWLYLPETKNRSLQEIELIFASKNAVAASKERTLGHGVVSETEVK